MRARALTLAPTVAQLGIGAAVLRAAVGAVMIAHGGQKLFVAGLGGVAEGFGQMGIPLPGLLGPAVALIEFLGGIALVVGLLTRVAAALVAVVMLGAIFFVHLSGGFFLPAGIEFAMVNLAGALAIFLIGPGHLSLDRVLAGRHDA